MKRPEKEEIMIENVLRLLRRGKFELTGDEALAFNQCFSYFVSKLQELRNAGKIVSEEKSAEIKDVIN